MKTKLNAVCFLLLVIFFTTGCKKYLDAKPDIRLSTPETLKDLQALLDRAPFYSAMAEIDDFSDEYFMPSEILDAIGPIWFNRYTWNRPATDESFSFDWGIQYSNIFYANTVLDNLDRISKSNQESEWNTIKGSALFYRAYNFYQLAQVYVKQYDARTADQDLGLCLRLTSDFNKLSTRATLSETYQQIIKDLSDALPILPKTTLHLTRPSSIAVHALLARVYLTMNNYSKAKQASEECLSMKNSLLDFNSLDTLSINPVPVFHEEIIFYAQTNNGVGWYPAPYSYIDSTLSESYGDHDLRRSIYMIRNHDKTYSYKTINNNGDNIYQGLSTNEMFLIKAECDARLGNTQEALTALNTLLKKRWLTGTFIPFTASNSDDALKIILKERKKELLFRGTRWTDIRRLNLDPRFAITLRRFLNGIEYKLPPNDLRYVGLIPQDVINRSVIPQNPR